MFLRGGHPFYIHKLMLRGGPPSVDGMSVDVRGGPPVDPGLKLDYKHGLISG